MTNTTLYVIFLLKLVSLTSSDCRCKISQYQLIVVGYIIITIIRSKLTDVDPSVEIEGNRCCLCIYSFAGNGVECNFIKTSLII